MCIRDSKNLSAAECERFLKGGDGLLNIDQVIEYALEGLELFHALHEKNRAVFDSLGVASALDMCLVNEAGDVDYYHGQLRVQDADKRVVAQFDYHDYLDHFSEAVEEWSYMKFPFLKALGREAGSLRVGPLARMNITRSLPTPLAQAALERFHAYTQGRANDMTLHYNWARAIEILHAAELIRDLLHDPDLQLETLCLTPNPAAWSGEGVGVVEAPRGVLLHHYRANESGEITSANLIVSTTQNNQVINRTVRRVAQDYLNGRSEITEGMMNAIEVGIRAYDPCLSCATHALGKMPLHVSVVDAKGSVVDERSR